MVPMVLDVVKDELCWIFGSVYMDVSLQPNILEDIQRDVTAVLGDECGRISLVGERLAPEQYVTRIIMAAPGIETTDPRPPVANLKSWTSCAGMAPHAGMDNVGSNPENDMDFDVPVAGLSVSTLSRLRFLDCVTVSPPGPHPRPTPRRPPSTPSPTASRHHHPFAPHPFAPHLHSRPTRTLRPPPHRVPAAAPGRTAPALPTDRRARTLSHSTPRIPRAVRPRRATGTFHAQVAAQLHRPNDSFWNIQ
ncbi:hypothetical protein JB92DRAFT_1038558 [Gautieria morchelliformis]|nr:hypothetical protein JB92DRAFT_1038558 [Gautieria morchelliformis]